MSDRSHYDNETRVRISAEAHASAWETAVACGQGPPKVDLRTDEEASFASSKAGQGGPGTGRYQILGEIARGGMGAVLRGRDSRAESRPRRQGPAGEVHATSPRSCAGSSRRRRSAASSSTRASCRSTTSAPSPDNRPFFAMKLVKGRTLAELLKERADPADDLPRFLSIFEQISQTVAYAHSKGVIHRDLKPANVMVGAFGEVQVMDWGLAKVLSGSTWPTRAAPPRGPSPA